MQVTALFRHPIKSHGSESLNQVALNKGQSMPFDRHWAVAHDHAKADGTQWAACANFSRVSQAPKLMAIKTQLNEATQEVSLSHPERDPITLHPTKDAQKLVEWLTPLVPENRSLPAQVFALPKRGFTDAPYPSLSLCNVASHQAVESLAMTPLSPQRWRGNIWFNGASAWEEFNWVDRDIRIGTVLLRIKERIERCMATTANPDTGVRDVDTLRHLNTLGHQDFGLYAEVIETGQIALGDALELV